MRSLVLAVLTLALIAPAAQASVADQWFPIKGAADGVSVKRAKGGYAMRFSQRRTGCTAPSAGAARRWCAGA